MSISNHIPLENYFCKTRKLMNVGGCSAIELKDHYGELKTEKGAFKVINLAGKITTSVLKITAFAVATLLTFAIETILLPFSYLAAKSWSVKQIKKDQTFLTDARQAQLRQEIDTFIEKEGLKVSDHAREIALATYASSQQHYGPIVLEWVTSLFETAKLENRKIVFLARDGRPPFEVAKLLKEKYPEKYGDVDISYVYLSRKVVKSSQENKENPKILQQYLEQSGLEHSDKCIFVDIGFNGSMIDKIKHQCKSLNLDIEYQFLISLTKKARGFLGDLNTKVSSVPRAGLNKSVHWLEDIHQGTISSPKKLMASKGGKIAPDIFFKDGKNYNPKNPVTSKKDSHFHYLLQHFGLRGVVEYVEREGIEPVEHDKPKAWRKCSEAAKKRFDNFLGKYRDGDRYKFIDHI